MKKIFSFVTIFMVCIFILCGCAKLTSTNLGNISSQFVKLEKFDETSGLCYDKDTKIIYVYSLSGNFNNAYSTWTYSPYYVMNMNDEPVIAIYNGDKADDEN